PSACEEAKGAFHEPYEFRIRAPIESGGGPPHSKTLPRWRQSRALPPGFGVRRPCGALDCPDRFMVPVHAKKRKGALHEPWFGVPPSGGSNGLDRLKPGLQAVSGFMVPMHGIRVVRARHEQAPLATNLHLNPGKAHEPSECLFCPVVVQLRPVGE